MTFGTAGRDDGSFPRTRARYVLPKLGCAALAAATAAVVWAASTTAIRYHRHASAVRTGATGTLPPTELPRPPVPLGAFVGSGPEAVERLEGFEKWLGAPVTVGHTYLPGETWRGIEGPADLIKAWGKWRAADPRRMLVINVPMLAPNEVWMPDVVVSALLRGAASGSYDVHFSRLAERLVAAGAGDAIIVLGWEMNGITYTGRCAPNPAMWKIYWRRIVATMRSVDGARFRFDFTPSRGRDAIPWTDCYPGDDVVDIIGMDSYDQPTGMTFADFVTEPYGLRAHADFARAHGKPISFPEWGLFRNSDNPEYIQGMHRWFASHNVVYQTISDYCPHGVWRCADNPRSSAMYRLLFGKPPLPSPGMPPVPSLGGPSGPSSGPRGSAASPTVPTVSPTVSPTESGIR